MPGGTRLRPTAIAALALFAAWLATAGCTGGANLEARVTCTADRPRELVVTESLSHVAGDSLVLTAYSAADVMGIDSLSARDGRGTELTVAPAPPDPAAPLAPRWRVRGPVPARVTLRYVLRPSARGGNAHVGYDGTCLESVSRGFVVTSGRFLFLLPVTSAPLAHAHVSFALPAGWSARTGWRSSGAAWLPAGRGEALAADLVGGPVALGAFRDTVLRVNRTTLRLAIEHSVPSALDAPMARAIAAAAADLGGLLGSRRIDAHQIVAAPLDDDGDDICGEGSAGGQAATLAPLTPLRLHRVAERLVLAALVQSPRRPVVSESGEFWWLDAVRSWRSWRAVAAAGLADTSAVTRVLALGFVNALHQPDVEWNLERLYDTTRPVAPARELGAPLALVTLERRLGRAVVDAALDRAFANDRARSVWAQFHGEAARAADEIRTRYVRAREPWPLAPPDLLTPTASEPPSARRAVATLTLVVTGNTFGFLENCGCKLNQSGGLARRATVLARVRAAHPEALAIDAGNAFARARGRGPLDALAREEQGLYARGLALLHEDVLAVGESEIAAGRARFGELARDTQSPWVCANVRDAAGRAIAPASVVRRAGALRVGVIGVLERPGGPAASPAFEDAAADLHVDDPVHAVEAAARDLEGRCDVLVAAGPVSPATARAIAVRCPQLAMVVTPDDEVVVRHRIDGHDVLGMQDTSGFAGATWVQYTSLATYGVHVLSVGVDSSGHVVALRNEEVWLDESVPDRRDVRAAIDAFYDEVGRRADVQASAPSPFAADERRMHGEYAGAAACRRCHEREWQQWSTTPHASALKTLLDVHRHWQPHCVSCHVTAWGVAGGYRLGSPDRRLAGVQCETCHGPSAAHARRPEAVRSERLVTGSVCTVCHTADHSDHFDFATRLPRVIHVPAERGTSLARQSP